jgi:hypothetical protein
MEVHVGSDRQMTPTVVRGASAAPIDALPNL